MSEMAEYKPGTFCWPELVASDSGKAKEFYSKLFSWDITDVPIGNDNVYSMAHIRGKETAALYEMWPEQKEQGIPTHWASYISVSNVDEVVEKAESLGAAMVVSPMDVFDAGRMAAIIDPTGAIFSVWQPLKHIGAKVVNEHGALVWNELATNDTEKAKEFYTELFGWQAQDMDFNGIIYTMLMNGDRPAAGMLPIQEEWCVPPVWFVYFAVNNCDVIVDESVELGGEIVIPAKDLPDVGRMAFLKDSQGAMFAVIALNKLPD
ncbi:MAG: putative glyoxylase CFP32 [Thermodesulfobacteriota bacterium]|nr:MAG: putative glyoxylase CFP32 [Thermodesulfobacteriota bacterium]